MANEITELDNACLWGPTMKKSLIDIIVDEVNTENMTNGQFSSNTWSKILEKLQSKNKHMFSMKQVKQKYNRLRTKYHEFAKLLKQTSFGWDRETNTVTAIEEIWQNYLGAHPKASQYHDERELEGEFDQKDIRNNDDHDSTSCTSARLVDEVFNRSSKCSETTNAKQRSKKNRS
ncbi:Myb/SANT-like domain containing protein [Trema orientale]|uniref:Myb/SANT-like domain containing protein n=1 Tax=Trema orientale TaxID=63057 RepID=A0A2P5DEC5_TREOI|nr:Myb/SANT-like domain containing protein [Trema orientale]